MLAVLCGGMPPPWAQYRLVQTWGSGRHMRDTINLIVINGFITVRCIIMALDSMASSSYVNKIVATLPPPCGPDGDLSTRDFAALLAAAKYFELVGNNAPTAKFLHITELPDFLVSTAHAHEGEWGGYDVVRKAIAKQLPMRMWEWKWGAPSGAARVDLRSPIMPDANLVPLPGTAVHTPSVSSSGDELSESSSEEETKAEEESGDPFSVSSGSGSGSKDSSEPGDNGAGEGKDEEEGEGEAESEGEEEGEAEDECRGEDHAGDRVSSDDWKDPVSEFGEGDDAGDASTDFGPRPGCRLARCLQEREPDKDYVPVEHSKDDADSESVVSSIDRSTPKYTGGNERLTTGSKSSDRGDKEDKDGKSNDSSKSGGEKAYATGSVIPWDPAIVEDGVAAGGIGSMPLPKAGRGKAQKRQRYGVTPKDLASKPQFAVMHQQLEHVYSFATSDLNAKRDGAAAKQHTIDKIRLAVGLFSGFVLKTKGASTHVRLEMLFNGPLLHDWIEFCTYDRGIACNTLTGYCVSVHQVINVLRSMRPQLGGTGTPAVEALCKSIINVRKQLTGIVGTLSPTLKP
ncbi:hypothetical protein FOA52_008425 [Chlamydomonas sp. UWO 241]|nr:hypothetical protein FOA52_008425 [Chlamydomonas sp. UWO 241]